MEAWSIPIEQKTAKEYPRTDLKLCSPLRCQGAKKEWKHWVRSCNHRAILRKTPGQKPVVPWEQTSLTRMCAGGAAEPETHEACHFEAPLGSPQDSQPIFRHTSDLWHTSFAQVTGTGVIILRVKPQFHLHVLIPWYVSTLLFPHSFLHGLLLQEQRFSPSFFPVRRMQYYYLYRELKRCLWWSRKLFGIGQGNHNLPGMLKVSLLPQDEAVQCILG